MENGSDNGRNRRGQFANGNKGGPGRQRGSRQKLTEKFLTDLEQDWRKHGKAAIEKAREAEPMQYCTMVGRLLPKHIDANLNVGLTDQFLNALRLANAPRGALINGTAEPVEDAPSLLTLNGSAKA
jgi:hypothetical protein